MGSAAWDSRSHSAVLITSQLLSFSLRKRGEGSCAGSSHAPALVIAPKGRDMGFILLGGVATPHLTVRQILQWDLKIRFGG